MNKNKDRRLTIDIINHINQKLFFRDDYFPFGIHQRSNTTCITGFPYKVVYACFGIYEDLTYTSIFNLGAVLIKNLESVFV